MTTQSIKLFGLFTLVAAIMFMSAPTADAQINALTGTAYDVSGMNGDTTLGNIGSPGTAPSLLTIAPKDTILIDGTDRIDYRNDGDFNNGNVGNLAEGFPNLNQNDNFATGFRGFLNIPAGVATVEIGTNRADDPVQIYVDVDQDNVFNHGQGPNFNPGGVSGPFGDLILNRDCCGNGFVTIPLTEGSYEYFATQLERGGGSQIEPTIALFDAQGGTILARTTVQPGQLNGLFTDVAPQSAVPEPSAYTLGIMALASFGMIFWRRRRR